ncbi:MAG: hypothetical protein EKK64_08280 [Neisseriaceae bacterium]|nr:MAG: hypothetical protein EKK64_08280 [Neisseriaceae bacterium]
MFQPKRIDTRQATFEKIQAQKLAEYQPFLNNLKIIFDNIQDAPITMAACKMLLDNHQYPFNVFWMLNGEYLLHYDYKHHCLWLSFNNYVNLQCIIKNSLFPNKHHYMASMGFKNQIESNFLRSKNIITL